MSDFKWNCSLSWDHVIEAIVYAERKGSGKIGFSSEHLGQFLVRNPKLIPDLKASAKNAIREHAGITKKSNLEKKSTFSWSSLTSMNDILSGVEYANQYIDFGSPSKASVFSTALGELLLKDRPLLSQLEDSARGAILEHTKISSVAAPKELHNVSIGYSMMSPYYEDLPKQPKKEKKQKKKKKLKVPDQETLDQYIMSTGTVFAEWGLDTTEIEKLSKASNALNNSSKNSRQVFYEKLISIVSTALKEKDFDLKAKKNASMEEIRAAITSEIENCVNISEHAGEDHIRGVQDDLMTLQDTFEKLAKLAEPNIALPMIRMVIWKRVCNLQKEFAIILAKII
jgi:hypothetical protein